MLNLADIMGIKELDSIDELYQVADVIGRGAFGEVVKAQHLLLNEDRAIKIIDKRRLK